MKSKINECPYKDSGRDKCVHKFGKKQTNTRRKCGYKNPLNCPLFMEWIEIRAQEEEKSKIKHSNSGLGVSNK